MHSADEVGHPAWELSKMVTPVTPSSEVLLDKLIVTQLVKKLTALYGTQRFINMFSRVRHWFLS
jgi:hypothetical protein